MEQEHIRMMWLNAIDEVRDKASELAIAINELLAAYIIDCKILGEEYLTEEVIPDYIGYLKEFEEVENLLNKIP